MSCASPSPTEGVGTPLSAEESGRYQQAFLSAARFCEARVLGARLTPERAEWLGDVSLTQYAEWRETHDAIPSGPHAGALPRHRNLMGENACFASVGIVEGGSMESILRDGFCRADFNYCLGRELTLHARTLDDGPSSVELEAELLRRSRERLQAAAVEYVSSFAFYERVCDADPGIHGYECTRLGDFGYADVATARLGAAVERIIDLAEREHDARARAGLPPTGGAESEVPRQLWGFDGARTLAAATLFGPVDDLDISFRVDSRRSADVPAPAALPLDDRPARALTLLEELEVPVNLMGPASPAPGGYQFADWSRDETLQRATFNLLDHRLSAASSRYPYEATDAAGSAEARALRRRARLTTTDYLAFASRDIAPERSILRTEYDLSPEDIGDAFALAADLVETRDARFELLPQVDLGGDYWVHALRVRTTRPRSAIPLIARLADDDGGARRADSLTPLMAPVPRDGGPSEPHEWYTLTLSRVDASQRRDLSRTDSALLGAAHALQLLRVHLLRVAGELPFERAQAWDEIVRLIDAAIGASWTELDTAGDLACLCDLEPTSLDITPTPTALSLGPISPRLPSGRLGDSLSAPIGDANLGNISFDPVLPPPPVEPPPIDLCAGMERVQDLPLYAPCESCVCEPRPEVLDEEVLRWELFEPADDRREGRPVIVHTYDEARCLIEGVVPGSERPCEVDPTVPEELPAASTAATLGRASRRFALEPGSGRRFVLWESVDGYALVDVVEPGRRAAVHPIGGRFAGLVAASWATLPTRPSRPTYTATDVRSDLVPPLESELTSDSDAYEDSFRRYLAEASLAAERASELLDEARTDELRIRMEEELTQARLEEAALAETAELADLCGEGGSCAVERVDIGTIELGLVTPVEPPEGQTPASCASFLDQLHEGMDLYADEVEGDRREYVEGYLRLALGCAAHVYTTAFAELEIRDLPVAVRDELLADGSGDFPSHQGELRRELVLMYQALADAKSAFRRFGSEVESTEAHIRGAARQVADLWNTSRDRAICRTQLWLGVIEGVAGIVGSVASISNNQGAQGAEAYQQRSQNASSARGAANDLAGIGGAIQHGAETEHCSNNFAGEDAAESALVQVSRSLETLRAHAASARDGVVGAYLGVARLEQVQAGADMARERRVVADRIARTDSVADLPEWAALQGFRARRAEKALERAIRAAFVARRAIEFRLGVDMSTMVEPEPFVPAPATWVNELDAVRAAVVEVDEEGTVSTSAEAVADYVDRLERFVDGYGFARRFRDATDVQVLDLRALVGLEDGAWLHERMTYRCADGADELGRPRVVPCAERGGVSFAEISFVVPARLRGYLEDRLGARDAYNYRHEALALNVIGSALLDCDRALYPDECFEDANLPFELRQAGQVLLESFEGQLHSFAMEPGRIQRGRALAAERVLTTPLSRADAAMVAPYYRSELRGRPLRGVYTLRIPGRPEIDWTRFRSVQLLLRYRYWTRQVTP